MSPLSSRLTVSPTDAGRAHLRSPRPSRARGLLGSTRFVATAMCALLLAACAGDGPTGPESNGGGTTPPVTPPPPTDPGTPPTSTVGALQITVNGLPTGTNAAVLVRGGGREVALTASRRVDSLVAGDYTITAEPVLAGAVTWLPEPASQVASVRVGQGTPNVVVTYRAAGATLVLSATGLPSYARGTVRLALPDGSTRTALTGDTVRGLPTGTTQATADAVETTDGRFEAVPSTKSVTLASNGTSALTFAYGAPRSALTIETNGLPASAPAGIQVAGPNGFATNVDATRTLEGLDPGLYSATARRVTHGGYSWEPSRTREDITVAQSQRRTIAFGYSLVTGALAVSVSGLPSGANAVVSVTGPGGFSRTLTGTQTLTDLAPGSYTVAASSVTSGGVTYRAEPASVVVSVSASLVAAPASIVYLGDVGAAVVNVNGLPPTALADVKLTSPGGAITWVRSSQLLTGLAPGDWTLDAGSVTTTNDTYDPEVTRRVVKVRERDTVSTDVEYKGRKGELAIDVVGLPDGVSASVRVTGSGTNTVLNGSATLMLNAGTYTIEAGAVVAGSTQYTADPTSTTVTIERGKRTSKAVSYAGQGTSLAVSITGVPGGSAAAVRVTGPSGYDQALTASTTLSNLGAGTYTVTAARIAAGGFSYDASPSTQSISIATGDRRTASVAYALATGALAVSVGGLPGGTAAAITVTGPAGFSRTVTSTTTLTDLTPGTYTVAAASVSSGGATYAPSPASRTVTVSASLVAAAAPVSYAVQRGALRVTLNGLPTAVTNAVRVTGPSGFDQALSQTGTFTDLTTGSYSIVADTVYANGDRWAPTPRTQSASVVAGDTALVTVSWARITAQLTVTIGGLSGGPAADVTVSGPSGFTRTISSTSTITGLVAGTYTIAASSVASGATTWTPTPASQTVTLTAGGNATRSVTYTGQGTQLAVNISGVPSGANASVAVSGPGGFSQSLTGSQVFSGIATGSYTISASRIVHGGYGYTGAPASQSVSLTSGEQKSATVTYTVATGALTVNVSGLPDGVNAGVTVTGPGSFSQTVTATRTFTDLAPGTYTVAAATVTNGATQYTPGSASQTVSVSAGATASRSVAYTGNGTSLTVTVSGLPGGANAAVTVTGPGGFSQSVTATRTFDGLAAGTYTIAAANVANGGHTYAPTPTSQTASVTTGSSASRSVTYALATGAIAVSASGLPGGTNAAITVSGPASFSQSLTGTQTLTNLAPGTYTVAAANVSASGYTYAPTPTSRSVTVAASLVAQSAPVAYAATDGRLTVTVSGLPGGTNAAVTVTGPGSYSQTVTATTTLSGLAPGSYTVAAANVTSGSTTYAPSSASQAVTVSAGTTQSRSVSYGALVTKLTVNVGGLPGGANANVNVTGPGSYAQALTGTQTLSGLTAGTYTVAASNVSAGGYTYTPSPASQGATLTAGDSLARTVTYAASTGRLTVTVSGLPGGTSGAITVTGPGSYSQAVTATTTLGNLTPGTYTLSASNVTSGGTTYAPTATSQTASVTAGSTASRTVTYAAQGGGGGGGGSDVNLAVDAAYLTQAIQKYDGSVTLVANRDALLRVFVTAASTNSLAPTVRVRLSQGGSVYRTLTINAPSASVPTTVTEGTLNSSWNTVINGSDIRTGMAIQVDVDPSNTVNEPDETDNVWPRSGTQSISVQSVPSLNLRFVPVHMPSTGLTGNVSTGNMESIFSMARDIWPLEDVSLSVRSTYTSNAAELQSGDGNFAWLTVLSEMNTLRSSEGSSGQYYAGIVGTSYGSGVAGYAYRPGRASVSWDKSGTVARVFAHEIGHNFGRPHVAACGAGSTDPNYPYSGGSIANFGWSTNSGSLIPNSRTDIMGYCSSQWVSDYQWNNVLSYRQSAGSIVMGDAPRIQPVLMVWGTIVNGQVRLEPAFRTEAYPSLPSGGPNRLELRAADGSLLAGFGFTGEEVDHLESGRTFTFAIPLTANAMARLDRISVRTANAFGGAEQQARPAAKPSAPAAGGSEGRQLVESDEGVLELTAPEARATRSGTSTQLTWRTDAYPLAIVRDVRTGEILSFMRKDTDRVLTGSRREVAVTFSDGVHSVTQRVPLN